MSKPWWRRIFKNDSAKAEQAVSEAIQQVTETELHIQDELDSLHNEHSSQRTLLQRLVQARALKPEIMAQTQRVKSIAKQIVQKKKLLGNMHRERQQLDAVATNSGVAVAMKASVEAQRKLLTVTTDGDSIDGLLDDVDEYRQETSDMAERLGAMGGMECDDFEESDDAFSSEEIMRAMGWQPSFDDDLLVEEIHAMVDQSAPCRVPVQQEPITINARGHLHVNTGVSTNSEFDFPDAPTTNRSRSETRQARGDAQRPWSF